MSERFPAEMLPHDVNPDDTLYVADRDLNIVYSNDEWSRFASENKGDRLFASDWNRNLLANLSGSQRDRWRHIYDLLLEGRLPHHDETMNCSSPEERRIYRLRVTPQTDASGRVAWLVHHNVRVDGEHHAVQRVDPQLRELDDERKLERSFRRRIVDREVRIPSFEVAVHYEPLEQIGGDLVWHREYPDGVCDLVHADVVGHGLEAGRLAAKMMVMLDELASIDLSPRHTVAALNRALGRIVPEESVMFATGLCFRFEHDRQRVTCCSFGHEGPIFSRAGPVHVPPGYPVGLALSEKPWAETELDLRELGTRFLVFSDGMTEQFDADGVMFEVEGLEKAFRRHLDASLDDMVRAIVQEVARFRGDALVKDDQTLLALEFVGD